MINRRIGSLSTFFVFWLITFLPAVVVAQSPSEMPMRDGMMMGGWFMLLCAVFGVLIFAALILAILALWKYLFGTKRNA